MLGEIEGYMDGWMDGHEGGDLCDSWAESYLFSTSHSHIFLPLPLSISFVFSLLSSVILSLIFCDLVFFFSWCSMA